LRETTTHVPLSPRFLYLPSRGMAAVTAAGLKVAVQTGFPSFHPPHMKNIIVFY